MDTGELKLMFTFLLALCRSQQSEVLAFNQSLPLIRNDFTPF